MTTGHRIRSMHTTGIVFHWPRLYDLLVWALTFGRERAYRERLADLARLVRGESALDVGCGTGGLAIVLRQRLGPSSSVHGIYPSPEMIAMAHVSA